MSAPVSGLSMGESVAGEPGTGEPSSYGFVSDTLKHFNLSEPSSGQESFEASSLAINIIATSARNFG